MSMDAQDDPTCPYCLTSWTPEGASDYEADYSEVECPHCEKTFYLTANHSVNFDSRKMECKGPHEWGPPEKYDVGRECADRWNQENFLGRRNHKPYTSWSRDCLHCDEGETSGHLPVGARCPWSEGTLDAMIEIDKV